MEFLKSEIMKKLSLLFLSIIVSAGVFAQDIISVDDLVKNLRDQNLVVISAGPKAEYDKQHITGAVNIPYNSFDKSGSNIEGILMADADMAIILGDRGVSEKNTIVVYDEFDGRYATRIYFLLKYLGAKDVKVLHGGMEAWKAARKPITRNPTNIAKKTFAPAVNKGMMITAQELNRPNMVLVDARAAGEYQGRERDSKGHIKGAINIDYKELLTADGKLKPKADIEKLYSSKGIAKDKEIVLYCSSGVRACMHYMVLTSYLGFNNVKIYDGGYNEWVSINPTKIAQ
jgi:thiosulfate/3-mercaptopyruvate sulfurtransferase